MVRILLVLIVLVVGGCAGLDSMLSTSGVIKESVSKFDGRHVITMSPALFDHGSHGHYAGLYWDNLRGDYALFEMEAIGTYSFVPNEPFLLKIDGRLVTLEPENEYSSGEIEYDNVLKTNVSNKDYIISKQDILAFSNAKETTYRVHLRKGFLDGEINYNYPELQSYAAGSFKTFYDRVWGNTKAAE